MTQKKANRKVKILAIAFTGRPEDVTPQNPYPIRRLDEMKGYIESSAEVGGQDLILLPEFWPGASVIQRVEDEIITEIAALARKYHSYIICPISRRDERFQKLNSAVLISREGEVMGVYDKNYPFWSEYDVAPAPMPGVDVPVFDLDFGRVGMAICFDANFPCVWEKLGKAGAEIVFWPSAYSAGSQLAAHALNHHYYIVTATTAGDSLVYDINGERISYQSDPEVLIARHEIDLDRGIYHCNFNMENLQKLLEDHGDEVEVEKEMPLESWFILRAKKEGVEARKLAGEYGLTELREYKYASEALIDRLREEGIQALRERGGAFWEYVDDNSILPRSTADVFKK